MDSFYLQLSEEQHHLATLNQWNLDTPFAIDMDAVVDAVQALKDSRSAYIPTYDFKTHKRLDAHQYLYGASVLIVEGLWTFFDPRLRDLLDLKVFVQCDSDVALIRRLQRDTIERGRDIVGIFDQYLKWVKPGYEQFVAPTQKFADVTLQGLQNDIGVELMVTQVRKELEKRSLSIKRHLVSPLALPKQPENVTVLPMTPQIQGLHTILKDIKTSLADFVFYSDRLAVLLAEHLLHQPRLLDFTPHDIQTPQGHDVKGLVLKSEYCSVSILRAGAVLERGLRRIRPALKMGSLLISDDDDGEPCLFHISFPECLQDPEQAKRTTVLLLTPCVSTGATVMMALRVLKDHGVKKIVVMSFIATKSLWRLAKNNDDVQFVTTALENQETGLGDFAQRSFRIILLLIKTLTCDRQILWLLMPPNRIT